MTFAVTKSNYALKPEPVLLRRETEHGGALVPLTPDDLQTIKDVRMASEIETLKAQARRTQADERERREDIAVLLAVLERPGLTKRKLRDPVKDKAKVGSDRADTAIERARKWLDIRPSNLRDADGDPVALFYPPSDVRKLPEHFRHLIWARQYAPIRWQRIRRKILKILPKL